ncbi:MAG TPA: N-6 DNA methylase, partial [Candidatus Polarisedimenticolia bacterium]|nr:N-6 DNA methylase [Candidatus Polarisedimenticolia bacterium]
MQRRPQPSPQRRLHPRNQAPSGPGQYPETLSRAFRKARGVFYTPERLVTHLLAVTLEPLLERGCRLARRGELDEALRLRILDPAVGDGAFLRGAADLISSRLASAAGYGEPEVRRLVVARCLFGIDIDPVALRRARSLFTMHGPPPTLVCADSLAPAFPVPGPFDAVIGNPPWGGWDRGLTAEEKQDYRRRFVTAAGRLEPSLLFLERATGLLAEGGRLGLVLPDVFLLKNYPAARRHVLEHYRIDELAHWGLAFPGVSMDACTLAAVKVERVAAGVRPDPTHRIRCLPEGPGGRSLRIPQERFTATPGHVFNLTLNGRRAALLEGLQRRCAPLGDWLETHEGIHSGNIRRRLFIAPRRASEDHLPARPLILGRDEIRPFRLEWGGWRVRYDPRVIRAARGDYANLGHEAWFTSSKILVRRT